MKEERRGEEREERKEIRGKGREQGRRNTKRRNLGQELGKIKMEAPTCKASRMKYVAKFSQKIPSRKVEPSLLE